MMQVTFQRGVLRKALLAMALGLSVCGYAGIEEEEATFSVVLHTRYANKAQAGVEKIEFKNVTAKEFARRILLSRAMLKQVDQWRNATIVVYLSESRSAQFRKDLERELQEQFKSQFGVPATIEFATLKRVPVDVAPALPLIEQAARAIHEANPGVDLHEMEAVLERARDAVVAIAEGQRVRSTLPEEVRAMVKRYAIGRLAVTFGLRALVAFGIIGDLPAEDPYLTAAVAGGAASVVEFLMTKHREWLQDYFQSHGLIFEGVWEKLAPLEKWYRENDYAMVGKQLVSNYTINSLAIPLGIQAISSLVTPETVHSPTWDDAGNLAENGAYGAAAFVCGQWGCRRLFRNGYLSKFVIEKWMQRLGLLDVVSNFLNSFPGLRHWRIVPQGIVWTTYMGILGASFVLPPINRRYVVIDDALGSRSDIDKIEGTDVAVALEPTEEAVAAHHELIKHQKIAYSHNWCSRKIANLVETLRLRRFRGP